MYGYNYDELYEWAERLKAKLLTHRRIKEVLINSEHTYWKDDYQEYYFDLDKKRMAQEGIDASTLFALVRLSSDVTCRWVPSLRKKGTEDIKLSSRNPATMTSGPCSFILTARRLRTSITNSPNWQ